MVLHSLPNSYVTFPTKQFSYTSYQTVQLHSLPDSYVTLPTKQLRYTPYQNKTVAMLFKSKIKLVSKTYVVKQLMSRWRLLFHYQMISVLQVLNVDEMKRLLSLPTDKEDDSLLQSAVSFLMANQGAERVSHGSTQTDSNALLLSKSCNVWASKLVIT